MYINIFLYNFIINEHKLHKKTTEINGFLKHKWDIISILKWIKEYISFISNKYIMNVDEWKIKFANFQQINEWFNVLMNKPTN